MTQHWNDIDNSSFILAFGANPAENHPACMAHVNAARFGTKKARMIVVDPRLTRTARQIDPNRKNIDGVAEPDLYVRIRPGTNVAFTNGVLNWILNNIATYNSDAAAKMLSWHNGTTTGGVHTSFARTFIDDAGTTQTFNSANLKGLAKYEGVATTALDNGYPKYCDTRFKVNANGDDYQRAILTCGTNNDYLTEPAFRFPEFPVIADNVSDPDCVYQKLKLHVAPYDTTTVADICGCTAADIVAVAQAFIDNSRFASDDFAATQATPGSSKYRATTILYAMGQTQHTNGSQNIKDLAVIQTLMGNMGRPGGGINALRGIHNVQGSTDWGLLYDNIPGYSGNPGVSETYAHYSNTLFGNRVLTLHNTETNYDSVAKDYTVTSNLGLQQRGFHNMTEEWFANGTVPATDIDKLYNLWPKGNGVQHITTFRNMALANGDANRIIASLIWGQNPAVTEPNQTAVRAGLKNLDLMVVVDMFETETAAVDRKDGAPTYLIPACSHVEEAGSVTNSGRWLQWRERAARPKGNSKADIELLLRLAYAFDKAGAFSHITNVAYNGAASDSPTAGVWSTLTTKITGPAYKSLYGDRYGYTPGAGAFESVSLDNVDMWHAGASTPVTETVTGSEAMCEKIYREFARPLGHLADGTASSTTGGTMWIYSGNDATTTVGVGGYNGGSSWNADVIPNNAGAAWAVKNRAKSRNNTFKGAATNGANNYPRWGWAWLYNRRVFYNNGEIAADQADTFVSPGVVSLIFTEKAAPDSGLTDWSAVYRKYKTLADAPSVSSGPHFVSAGKTFMGRFPGHTEPVESPRPDLVATWGHNTAGGAALVPADTPIGMASNFPLVLTTIRCVEHFQGGPITRNNSWNVEAEPVPWIEINSEDAIKYGIADGDWVNVATARSDSQADQEALSPNSQLPGGAHWARGFKARVGVGLISNQRVAPGVVAIPWHWGDKGLSTGSRANDLCIDAFDANTQIPEYKACLCSISKM